MDLLEKQPLLLIDSLHHTAQRKQASGTMKQRQDIRKPRRAQDCARNKQNKGFLGGNKAQKDICLAATDAERKSKFFLFAM